MKRNHNLWIIEFTLLFSFLISFSSALIKGYWTSTQTIEIPEKKISNTVFTQGIVYSNFWINGSQSRLSLNLYNVVVKVYAQRKNISTDKYDTYAKSYDYIISGNKIIDKNELDNNPWNFIKPLIIFHNLKRSFTLVTQKGEFLFIKNSGKFIISEVYNNYEISRGFVKITPPHIHLELVTNIHKNAIQNVKYTLRSTLIVNVKLE